MLITKADGTVEPFEAKKLRHSLRNSGAQAEEVEAIVSQIEAVLHEGMTTQEIYRHAFSLLGGVEAAVTARYSLRRALFSLGPTGFPFETFLARLFATQGYKTATGTMIKGKCATHEIDLAAYKADDAFIAEAKFHARPGLKSDLQVVMYSYARLLDLSEQRICAEDICGIKRFKLITNTKFTSTAIDYAKCAGVELLGWEYPKNINLFSMIEEGRLYPVTVLQGLSNAQKRILLENDIVVCGDLVKRPEVLNELGLSSKKTEALLFEARQLSPEAN